MQAEVIRFLPNEVRKDTDHTCLGPGGACPPGQGQGAAALAAGGIIPALTKVAQRPGGTYKRAMQYKTILFDLDGTLTDSEPGIVNSVRYALRSFGMEAEPATLRSFIGPPLYDSFRGTMGMSDADAKRAVDTYRVYFRDKGIFENAPYPGVPEMLEVLRAAGGQLIVATSKPEVFAKRIAEHFGFAGSLEGVYGADMEGKRSSKIDVIRYAMRERGITPSSAVMVGDRKYDITGAREAGLADIGVLYGYGSREELVEAGATRLAASVADLREMLSSSDG